MGYGTGRFERNGGMNMETLNETEFLGRVKERKSVSRFDFEYTFAFNAELSKKLVEILENLSNSDLNNSDLSSSDLSNSDLSSSDLSNSDLSSSDLSFANLSNSDLSFANLSSSDLSNSDLSFANLSNSNLRNSKLHGAKGKFFFNFGIRMKICD